MSQLSRCCGLLAWLVAVCCSGSVAAGKADAATIVALGASNTYGRGVARSEAYPAQLQALLRAEGRNVTVVNAGINGDTTAGMLSRLDRAVPTGTALVILQPGGNDSRKGSGADRESNIAAIQARLRSRGITVIVMENNMFRGLPHQPDGMHLTPEGYRELARAILPRVEATLAR
jgi:acyl-CoA thioesterase I